MAYITALFTVRHPPSHAQCRCNHSLILFPYFSRRCFLTRYFASDDAHRAPALQNTYTYPFSISLKLCCKIKLTSRTDTILIPTTIVTDTPFTNKSSSTTCYYYGLVHHLENLEVVKPVTVAARSKAWAIFARSITGMMSSNPTQGMDVCVRLLCGCVVLCVGSGLATGWPSVQEVLPTVHRLRNWKKLPRSTRAVEP
jgi:hypothetical protein